MATNADFVPAQPPRVADWLSPWRGVVGKRSRNIVYGIAEPAFDVLYRETSLLGRRMHICSDPDMIGHVLLDNKPNYERPDIGHRILNSFIGNGLLNAEGDDWKLQRRIVAPTFSPGAVRKMTGLMTQASAQQVALWPEGRTRLDIASVATRTTMAIIADALFSGDERLTSAAASKHIDNLFAAVGQPRILTVMGLEKLDISPTMRRARRSRDYLRGTLAAMVAERGPGGGPDDFFGGLIRDLHAQLPADEADLLAVDNAMTFYIAGHETTANALAWSAYLLAAQPALQEQARAEAVQALSGDAETLPERLPLLRQILDEAMRLYPPALMITREAQADDRMGDVDVRKGDLVMIYPWLVHRHRKLWDNPDSFDHTRFAREAKAQQHRFQYIPFGAGPRICVGARFAISEALIVLAQWLAARQFSVPAGYKPYPTGAITLRPERGLPLTLEPLP